MPDMEAIPGDPDAKVRLEVDGGVAAVRMVFEEPFSVTRWQRGCIGCELSLTLLFSADLSAPQDCNRAANDVDYLYDLVGSPSRINFSRERPPGEYVMLLASPGLAITNWGLGAADHKVEPTLVNVSATARIVEPEKIDETGPAPYTATFSTVATVERPAMVLTAFMAEARLGPGLGAGYEEGNSTWQGDTCGDSRNVSERLYHHALVAGAYVGSGEFQAGMTLAGIPPGSYHWSGDYQASASLGGPVQAGTFLLELV